MTGMTGFYLIHPVDVGHQGSNWAIGPWGLHLGALMATGWWARTASVESVPHVLLPIWAHNLLPSDRLASNLATSRLPG